MGLRRLEEPVAMKLETPKAGDLHMTTAPQNSTANKRPDFAVKVRKGRGENARFEQIGVVWTRDNGSMFCRLVGNQVVTDGFYIFPINREAGQ